jgi:hypothetical protein
MTDLTDLGELGERDADRLELLDRIKQRIPGLDLDQHEIEWHVMPDGCEVLLIDGGGIDGGEGWYLENKGDDLLAFGSVAPLIEGWLGCVVIKPDGSRYLARVVPDPLAQPNPIDPAQLSSALHGKRYALE